MSNDKSRLNSVLDVCEELIARGESPNLEALCGGDASLYSKAKESLNLLCRFEARFGESSSSEESTDATLPWRRHTAKC